MSIGRLPINKLGLAIKVKTLGKFLYLFLFSSKLTQMHIHIFSRHHRNSIYLISFVAGYWKSEPIDFVYAINTVLATAAKSFPAIPNPVISFPLRYLPNKSISITLY